MAHVLRSSGAILAILALAACTTHSNSTNGKPDPDTPYANSTKVEWPQEVRDTLEQADTFELMALHPAPDGMREESEVKGEKLHGYEILGATKLGPSERRTALEAVYRGIVESEGMVAACFNPRHGIRATRGDQVVELVICYECLSMSVYQNGEQFGSALTVQAPGKTLTKILGAHGIAIHRGF